MFLGFVILFHIQSYDLILLYLVIPIKLSAHGGSGPMMYFFVLLLSTRQVFGVSVVSEFVTPHGLYPTRLLCSCNFSGKNTGGDCHFLLQGIFWTQGLNPRLLHWQTDFFFTIEPPGKPKQVLVHREK